MSADGTHFRRVAHTRAVTRSPITEQVARHTANVLKTSKKSAKIRKAEQLGDLHEGYWNRSETSTNLEPGGTD